MKRKILFIRICYWIGAILDAATLIPMLSPEIGGRMYGITGFNPGIEYRYAMGLGASLMLGWTFLLLWADRKPVERRGVLLLTVFPVLTGLALSGIYAVNSGMVDFSDIIPLWILQSVLAILFITTYFYSKPVKSYE